MIDCHRELYRSFDLLFTRILGIFRVNSIDHSGLAISLKPLRLRQTLLYSALPFRDVQSFHFRDLFPQVPHARFVRRPVLFQPRQSFLQLLNSLFFLLSLGVILLQYPLMQFQVPPHFEQAGLSLRAL